MVTCFFFALASVSVPHLTICKRLRFNEIISGENSENECSHVPSLLVLCVCGALSFAFTILLKLWKFWIGNHQSTAKSHNRGISNEKHIHWNFCLFFRIDTEIWMRVVCCFFVPSFSNIRLSFVPILKLTAIELVKCVSCIPNLNLPFDSFRIRFSSICNTVRFTRPNDEYIHI